MTDINQYVDRGERKVFFSAVPKQSLKWMTVSRC